MKIVFFGVGAVCSVIARLLYDLSKKSSNDEIKFLFVVRDIIFDEETVRISINKLGFGKYGLNST